MSGPKISVYSLTGRARTIVQGQIRCERQSRECYGEILKIMKDIQTLSSELCRAAENSRILIKRGFDAKEEADRLSSLNKEIAEETEKLNREIAAKTPHTSAKYVVSEEAYKNKQEELRAVRELKKRAQSLEKKLCGVMGVDPEPRTGGKIGEKPGGDVLSGSAQNVKKIQESIIEDISAVCSFDDEEEEPAAASFQTEKDAVRKKLFSLLSDASLPDPLINEIKQADAALQKINGMQYLKTFEAVTVKNIYGKIEVLRRERELKLSEYAELCGRYEALCEMAGEEPKRMPCSEEAVSVMTSETERLERLLVRRSEQAYISECVDEVMADMGYELIGKREVCKKSGKRFKNELYSFNEGTAVNVTFSSDGQISMELGGLAEDDRVPTAEETEVLVRDMESFCGEFAEFERRMLAKGVIVDSRIALSPPTAEYASIINVNDYDVSDTSRVGVINAADKRRKQTKKKVKRKGEE